MVINFLLWKYMILFVGSQMLFYLGGIRRSATISLFSIDDQEMLQCKFGDWWETEPQRARANNSAVVVRHRVRKKDFFAIWEKVKEKWCGRTWSITLQMILNGALILVLKLH